MTARAPIPTWLFVSAGLVVAGLAIVAFGRGYNVIGMLVILAGALVAAHALLPKVGWRAVVALLCAGAVAIALIEVPIRKAADPAGYDQAQPYLVVLGAGLYGSTPSPSLLYRLHGSLAYLQQHPKCVAIVSGGQGPDEDIPEALAMRDWLVTNGIAPERVLMEDTSTSTAENLANSFAIIRARGDDPAAGVAIATNSYHVYRAELIARKLGVEASGVPCYDGNPVLSLNYHLREAAAVALAWIS